MKICSKCNQEKDDKEFYKNKTHKDKLQSWCKICQNRCLLDWIAANPYKAKEISRKRSLKFKHNISNIEFNNLLTLQNNVCAVCGEPETRIRNREITALMVDHDHKTNRNRGLLCHNCNLMIGHAKDNSEILLKGARYLEMFKY